MSTEWLGLLLLAVLFAAIFIGFPIAFTLIAVGAIGGWLTLGPLALHLMTLQVFSVMRDPTLASVPFFLFMGYLLEQSGLMERLFRGVQLALASIRGSLYLAVLLTATIFAAATGIVGSSVTRRRSNQLMMLAWMIAAKRASLLCSRRYSPMLVP